MAVFGFMRLNYKHRSHIHMGVEPGSPISETRFPSSDSYNSAAGWIGQGTPYLIMLNYICSFIYINEGYSGNHMSQRCK